MRLGARVRVNGVTFTFLYRVHVVGPARPDQRRN
jgi:hypothetical protein